MNTPFAVGSMNERCCPKAFGLSGLVLVNPILTLNSYLAFLVTCYLLLRSRLGQLMDIGGALVYLPARPR